MSAVYGVRWRIEIIFKAWKQHFHVPHFTNGSQTQIEILIYAKLLFITVFQVYVFRSWSLAVKQKTGLTLSLLKVAQFLAHHLWLIVLTLTRPNGVQQREAQIFKHCRNDNLKLTTFDNPILTTQIHDYIKGTSLSMIFLSGFSATTQC